MATVCRPANGKEDKCYKSGDLPFSRYVAFGEKVNYFHW